MRLNQEQAFKAGFLLGCAEDGLTNQETCFRIKQAIAEVKNNANLEKQAIAGWLAALLGVGSGLKSLVGGAMSTASAIGPPFAIGAPVGIGAVTGYGLAKLRQGGPGDLLADTKQDEIIDEYSRLADEAKKKALIKRIQNRTGKRIVPLSPSLTSE